MHMQAQVQEASGSPARVAAAACEPDTELTNRAAAPAASAPLPSQDRRMSSATDIAPVGSLPVKAAQVPPDGDDSKAATVLPDKLSSPVATAKVN